MKTLKILFAAFIIAGFATSAMANDQPSAAVDASAQIFAVIGITGEVDVDFGGVEANDNTAELDPVSGDVNFAGLGGINASLGRFDITGTGDVNIQITVNTAAVELANGGEIIMYTPAFGYAPGTGNANGTGSLDNGENTRSLSGGNGQVFVGGTLGDRTDKPAGVYTNEEAVQVTVEYI